MTLLICGRQETPSVQNVGTSIPCLAVECWLFPFAVNANNARAMAHEFALDLRMNLEKTLEELRKKKDLRKNFERMNEYSAGEHQVRQQQQQQQQQACTTFGKQRAIVVPLSTTDSYARARLDAGCLSNSHCHGQGREEQREV